MMQRRQLLRVGLAGAALLAVAAGVSPLLRRSEGDAPLQSGGSTDPWTPQVAGLFEALGPVMLPGLCVSPAQRTQLAQGVHDAIRGLPPAAQSELGQLFTLLNLAPARGALTGVWSAWPEAEPAALAAFLNRWQHSRFALFQSAYQAIHDLVMGAWYADPQHWAAIGYPGPPEISR